MPNNKMSVDDIIDEINMAQNQSKDPTSSMENVDSIIEQILLDKKNKELKLSKQHLSQSDIEGLEKEIKVQTKSLAKQYEKVVRENTKRLKKHERQQIKEQTSSISELLESFATLEEDLDKNTTQSLKLTTVHPDQKIKLSQPIERVTESLPNKDKIDAYKQNAHIDHIKREAMDITSHFGGFKEDPQTEISMNSYKKYKQSRNEKIDSFVLDSSPAQKKDKPAAPSDDANSSAQAEEPQNPDAPQQAANQVQQAAMSQTESPSSEAPREVADENYGAQAPVMDNEQLLGSLNRSVIFARISVTGLLLLSICALLLTLIKRTSDSIVLFNSIEMIPKDYINVNFTMLIIAIIFSIDVFKSVAKSVVSHEPSRDVLYLIGIVVMLITNGMLLMASDKLLNPNVHLYTPILVISLLFNSVSKLIILNKTRKNLSYIMEHEYIHSVALVESDLACAEMTQGVVDADIILAKNVKVAHAQDLMQNSLGSNQSDSYCLNTCVFVLPVAIIIFVGVYMLTKDIYAALGLLSCTVAVSTTFIGSLLVAFPLWDTATVTERFSEMSPCVAAIARFEDTNSVLVDAYELFPKGTVKLQGIKTFSGRRIDTAILDAASVLCKCKSALSHVFLDVIANNTEILKPVDSIVYEDLMGISAWVEEKKVLIGNRDLMINHSIPVPKKEYEEKCRELNQEVVYIATQGELCAAFILGLTTKKGIYDATNMLVRNDIKLIIKSVDAIFTVERISEIFGIDENNFKLLPSRLHKQFADEVVPADHGEVLIGNNETLLGFIIALVTTKRLSSCITSGIVLNTFSIALAIVLIGVAFFFTQVALLTCFTVLTYLGIFGIIYWLIQKNTHI